MPDISTLASPVVTGIFAVLAAILAWRLKRVSDDRERKTALALERQRELRNVYTELFQHLEQAIRCSLDVEPYDFSVELSRTNAQLRLLAPDLVNEAYNEVANRLSEWSRLHALASPQKMRIGDRTITLVQAPDPTAKYKAPAAEAHEQLQEALEKLRTLIRAELAMN